MFPLLGKLTHHRVTETRRKSNRALICRLDRDPCMRSATAHSYAMALLYLFVSLVSSGLECHISQRTSQAHMTHVLDPMVVPPGESVRPPKGMFYGNCDLGSSGNSAHFTQ